MSQQSEHVSGDATSDFLEVALKLLTDAATELFATYGCPLVPAADGSSQTAPDLTVGAAIGFTGEFVRGVLAIGVEDELARRLNPIGSAAGPGGAHDWIGELANQLLGRLKNKLLRYNVEVAISTPVVIHGSHLTIGTVHRNATMISFLSGENATSIWCHAEVDPALVLSELNAPDVQEEGAMVLF